MGEKFWKIRVQLDYAKFVCIGTQLKNNVDKGENMKLINKLAGYKTYILSIITAVLNLLVATGTISPDNMTQINIILGSLIAIALRSGIKTDGYN